jgi:hypothetical protein
MPLTPNQRQAAPWSAHHWWGRYTTASDLPNVAGSSVQLNRELQQGDVAFVDDERRIFVCRAATPGAATWSPLGFGGSDDPVDLFVATSGDDSNPGTSPSAPLATYNRAVELVELSQPCSAPIVVHIATGTYAMHRPVPAPTGSAPVIVVGDGAGQPGDDGLNVIATGVATAVSAESVLTTSGLTADAYQHLTVEVLTGAAAGSRRRVRNNTTTEIVPTAPFSAAIGIGDEYRIVAPAVQLRPTPGAFYLTKGVAGLAQQAQIGLPLDYPVQPVVGLASLALGCEGFASLFASTPTAMYGVDLLDLDDSGIVSTFGPLLFGCDYSGGSAMVPGLLGHPNPLWQGWGVHCATMALNCETGFCGYFSSNRPLILNGGTTKWLGGAVACVGAETGSSPAVYAPQGMVDLYVGTSFAPDNPPLVRNSGSANTTGIGLGRANGSSQYAGQTRLRVEALRVECPNAPAIQAYGDVHGQVGSTVGSFANVGISGFGTVGLRLARGARFWITDAPTITGSVGDVTVTGADGVPVYIANATVVAGYSNVAPDGTSVIRMF